MKKWFNDTGVCIPEKHYMVDISHKTEQIFEMIQRGNYFVINRPRQYGKTTNIYMLDRYLKGNEDYFPIQISFEGMGSESYEKEEKFIESFLLQLMKKFKLSGNREIVDFIGNSRGIDSLQKLGIWITDLVLKIDKKLVMMIDEVDKSSNKRLFLDFLGMLRHKYLEYQQEADHTFHSVILVGVHDIKNLKLKIRTDDEEGKYNSPWNIAVDFRVELSFNPAEIETMLNDYVKESGVMMDIKTIAEKLYYFTSGYPFLVSKLCKILDEEIITGDLPKQWQSGDIEAAVKSLLERTNTNFESLLKNLENNTDLYTLVEKMMLFGESIEFNRHSSIIGTGIMYGLFKPEGDPLVIHNRIYKELIYNMMTTNLRIKELLKSDVGHYNFRDHFITQDGSLHE